MASSQDSIDLGAIIHDVTESLGLDTPPASSYPTVGFTLHEAKMGPEFVLIKIFSGLSQGSFSTRESRAISRAFRKELGFWKLNFSSNHFVTIIGTSDYVDSVLPCPVYLQTVVAKDYLKARKDADLLPFLLHIAQAVEFLHQKNVKHGDIRADNILVGADGLPRLSDYGLSRIINLLDSTGCRDKAPDVNAAMRWMPPEFMQLEDDVAYTPSTQGDIWSLGMMLFELWSGNVPYCNISPERVPTRISQGRLPDLPGKLRPGLEALRQQITFLCNLCWKKDPAERKTAAQLVHILRELIEGKSIPSITKEFENRGSNLYRQPPSLTGISGHLRFPPSGSSISSSDTSNTTEPSSIDVNNIVSPTDDYDSGYETTREGSRSRTTVKTEEESTVSGWSHTGPPSERNANINDRDAFLPTGNTQGGVLGRRPSDSHRRPFSAFPPPPSPSSPLDSVSSWMTALLNYKAKHKLTKLEISRRSVGDDHQPHHTTICTIDGREYACSTDAKKKRADEQAARVTLTRLYNENPSLAADSSPSYLSTFRSYLAENELSDRIEWACDRQGDDHCPIWTCIIRRDGTQLAVGEAATKKKAEEEAAKKAAASWL